MLSLTKWSAAVAVVAMVALVVMTLFPAAHGEGSFQSVNGPTTVFQALRAALFILLLLISTGRARGGRLEVAIEASGSRRPACQSLPLLC